MVVGVGIKTPDMNWNASDLRDELVKFKEYCANLQRAIKNSEKEQASFILL